MHNNPKKTTDIKNICFDKCSKNICYMYKFNMIVHTHMSARKQQIQETNTYSILLLQKTKISKKNVAEWPLIIKAYHYTEAGITVSQTMLFWKGHLGIKDRGYTI